MLVRLMNPQRTIEISGIQLAALNQNFSQTLAQLYGFP